MPETNKLLIERFNSLALADPAEFRQFFRRLRKSFPQEAAEACLMYLASHGVDTAAHSIAFWFGGDASYIDALLDRNGLSLEEASHAVATVKDIDPNFMTKFQEAVTQLESTDAILHAMSLLPAIGDYSDLIPWLKKLGKHHDVRVRSKAGKLFCELRPIKVLVERQMKSEDSRVRASAVEALVGRTMNPEDARSIFRAALRDKNHRVVGNALVGLYAMGDTEAVSEMISFSSHEDHLFRAAMAWAMGFVKDLRALPTLRELTNDPSLVVRKRALNSLLILEKLEMAQSTNLAALAQATVPHSPETPVSEAASKAEPSFVQS